jgi:hypothetical protein
MNSLRSQCTGCSDKIVVNTAPAYETRSYLLKECKLKGIINENDVGHFFFKKGTSPVLIIHTREVLLFN